MNNENQNTTVEESGRNLRRVLPRADVFEGPVSYVIVAEMPGVDQSNIEISLEGSELTITGRSTIDLKEGLELAHREFEPCLYTRTFRLTDQVQSEGIDAVLRDGLLEVTVPKSEAVKPRKIPVKVVN